MGVIGAGQAALTIPIPVVATDDLTVTVGGVVVTDETAHIDADSVVNGNLRIAVVVNVKLAGLKVPPPAGGDLPVNGDCFYSVARVVASRGAVRAGMTGETPRWVPGVAVGSAGRIGGFHNLI